MDNINIHEPPERPTDLINRIAVKPPPFYRQNPSVWFKQLESQFVLARITDDVTKFHHVMSALPEDVALYLDTETDSYQELKEVVLRLYQRSRTELLEEALGAVSLDGQKPSLCILRIKKKLQQCNLQLDEELIKHKLLQAMPASTRSTLAGQMQAVDLQTFASIADAVFLMDQQSPHSHVNQIASHTPSQVHQKRNVMVPFHPSQKPQVCRFHVYYGPQAKRCKPWCKWPGRRPPNMDPSSRKTSPTRDRSHSSGTSPSEN